MRIFTFDSTKSDTSEAFAEMRVQLDEQCPVPSFVFAATNSVHDAETVRQELAQLSAHSVHAASSCLGTMTNAADLTQNDFGVAIFAIDDPAGDYGSGFQAIETDARAAAAQATRDALRSADRAGEIPNVVWVTATPGQEEAILNGIEDVIGGDVPIIGGSAADNSVNGDWYVATSEMSGQTAVVVSV